MRDMIWRSIKAGFVIALVNAAFGLFVVWLLG
jgi:hypothetical protein